MLEPSEEAINMANEQKQWTVMVYLAGDNDLDKYGRADLREMKKVGSTEDVNIVVQFDSAGHHHETRRYFIKRAGTLRDDLVISLGQTNTGDPQVLEDFVMWVFENYSAKKYLLVVWNHGNGWNDENVYKMASRELDLGIVQRGIPVVPGGKSISSDHLNVSAQNFHRALFRTSLHRALCSKGIAYDDDAQDFLDNIELKNLMARVKKAIGRKIDILGMDACLMSMAEVCYQLRESVELTVGSEEIVPEAGWPYDRILRELVKKPSMEPNRLVKVIVDKYNASYRSADGVTQSACRLDKCQDLAGAVDKLAKVLINSLCQPEVAAAVYQSRKKVQVYDENETDYIDLFDYCRLLKKNCEIPEIQDSCSKVMLAVRALVVRSRFKGSDMENSHGLSIYFPLMNISSLYQTLDFAKDTSWELFLRKL
jgi:hypothetical protein